MTDSYCSGDWMGTTFGGVSSSHQPSPERRALISWRLFALLCLASSRRFRASGCSTMSEATPVVAKTADLHLLLLTVLLGFISIQYFEGE
eukprot:CAMPEP_0177592190 /NCGR_PEP_ID=MMETSP0419_2-20121207/8421_1 /TAXON_ID=582737 /ORGANISM="Tetraselmis sp., Strain GSL018" /LENGTH=89 /DNA_ID=CAMNT_0019083027 /DNA_START=357 /DNA_END=626 /DNA_ORIENTATION=+